MKLNGNSCTHAKVCLMWMLAAIFILGIASGQLFAAEKRHEDRTELRIKDIHDKLKITAEQEALWSKVEEAMRADAKVMDALTQTRADHAKQMTAVDDLKSYGEITAAHADGISKLTPVFAALYDNMSEAQKKDADTLFRHGDHEHGHKHGHHKSDGA